jgi:hypothetical protein
MKQPKSTARQKKSSNGFSNHTTTTITEKRQIEMETKEMISQVYVKIDD